eukprot:scaffold14059_cov78-Skeletonema_dohrnii-CCMP3373.AAC.1
MNPPRPLGSLSRLLLRLGLDMNGNLLRTKGMLGLATSVDGRDCSNILTLEESEKRLRSHFVNLPGGALQVGVLWLRCGVQSHGSVVIKD